MLEKYGNPDNALTYKQYWIPILYHGIILSKIIIKYIYMMRSVDK